MLVRGVYQTTKGAKVHVWIVWLSEDGQRARVRVINDTSKDHGYPKGETFVAAAVFVTRSKAGLHSHGAGCKRCFADVVRKED